MKKLLFVTLAGVLFIISPISAYASEYESNNSVGFTGTYEAPPPVGESEGILSEANTLPSSAKQPKQLKQSSETGNQKRLPNTGSKSFNSLLGLLSLGMALILFKIQSKAGLSQGKEKKMS